MPPKRQSFLAKLENERPEPPEIVSGPVAATAIVNGTVKAEPEGRAGIRKTSIYIPDAVMHRLREIAFTERRKLHDLFLEGLDRVIENRGHPERSTRKEA